LSCKASCDGESEHPDDLAIEFRDRPGGAIRGRDVELLEKVFDLAFSSTNRLIAISGTPVANRDCATDEARIEGVSVARDIVAGDKLGDQAGTVW
jgi:hypothetical protein